MVLAKFMPDRSTPIEPESHSPMKNTAKTTSPAFLKRSLQFNDLQSSLMFRAVVYDPPTGIWNATGPLRHARSSQMTSALRPLSADAVLQRAGGQKNPPARCEKGRLTFVRRPGEKVFA